MALSLPSDRFFTVSGPQPLSPLLNPPAPERDEDMQGETLFLGHPLHVVLIRGAILALAGLALILLPSLAGTWMSRIDPTRHGVPLDPINAWFCGMLLFGLVGGFGYGLALIAVALRAALVSVRRAQQAAQMLPDYIISWRDIPRSALVTLAGSVGLPLPQTDADTVRACWVEGFAAMSPGMKRIVLHHLEDLFSYAVKQS